MTAKTTAQAAMVAGAASHDVLDWHAIDWRRVHQTVRRLQARIVKAIQEEPVGEGACLTTPAHPLVQCENVSRALSSCWG